MKFNLGTKRGKIALISALAVVLLGGAFALAKQGGFSIFADIDQSSAVTVKVLKDNAPVSAVQVTANNITFGNPTDANGQVTANLPYNTYNFAAGYPPNCTGAANNIAVNSAGLIVRINLSCTDQPPGTQPSPSPSPLISHTPQPPPLP